MSFDSLVNIVNSFRSKGVNLATATLIALSPAPLMVYAGCSDTDSCLADSQCPPGHNCNSGVCEEPEDPKPDTKHESDIQIDSFVPSKTVNQVNVGGIPVNSGFTNSEGRIDFWDSQSNEEVPTFAKDGDKNSLSDAAVIFEDGNGFETFHGDYKGEVYFGIFAHNSEKLLDWGYFKDVAVKFYDGVTNDNSYNAAKKYVKHTKNNGEELNCVLPHDIHLAQDERITAVIDLASLVPKVGSKAKKILTYTKKAVIDKPYSFHKDMVEKGIIAADDCKAYQTWHTVASFKKANISVMAAAELHNYKCLTEIPKEICDDGKDNDCDQKIDEYDPDCQVETCKDECDYQGNNVCLDNKIWKVCGDYDSDDCLEWSSAKYCGSNEECKEGKCETKKPTCSNDCNTNLEKICSDSKSWKQCGDYDSDKCLEWSSLKYCGSNEECKDGKCETKKPTCTDKCSPKGNEKCFTDKMFKKCDDYDGDGCLEWGPEQICKGTNYFCEGQGWCSYKTPACSDGCSSSGDKVCVDKTSFKECGDYDSDKCLEWSSTKSCNSNEECLNGKCASTGCIDDCKYVGQTACDSNGGSTAGAVCVKGSNGCLQWDVDFCDKNETCKDGKCITPGSCKDECSKSGLVSCYNSKTVSTCGNYDADSCLDVKMIKTCSDKEQCKDGKCVTQERFVDLGNGVVKDNKYGKLWQKISPTGNFSWSAANKYCDDLKLGGSSNWELPSNNNLSQMEDINGKCGINPMFNQKCGDYWSSTTCSLGGSSGNGKFIVRFKSSGVQGLICSSISNKLDVGYVRCIKK